MKTLKQILLAGVSSLALISPVLAQPPNIAIIGLDSAQGNYVDEQTTPNLIKLGKSGTFFARAISAAPWTVPFHATLFTGMYPSQHGLINFWHKKGQKVTLGDTKPLITIAQEFTQHGYRTAAFTGDAGVTPSLGTFGTKYDSIRFGSLKNSLQHAKEWLEQKQDRSKPFLLLIHGYDSHGQFDVENEPDRRAEQARIREAFLSGHPIAQTPDQIDSWRQWYRHKIHRADQSLGTILDFIHSNDPNTIILVYSDHGSEQYEHGGNDHGYSLYNELLHTILVIHDPRYPPTEPINTEVTTTDILPTLIELAGLDPSPDLKHQMVGRSLVRAIKGLGIPLIPIFSETNYRNNLTDKRSVQYGSWKLILTRNTDQRELYDLYSDPNENKNLINKNLNIENYLSEHLANHLKNDLNQTLHVDLPTECLPVYPEQCKDHPK